MLEKTSEHKMKRYSDRGSPCLLPLPGCSIPSSPPLRINENFTELIHRETKLTNLSGKPRRDIVAAMKLHSSLSNALLISSFTLIWPTDPVTLLFMLWWNSWAISMFQKAMRASVNKFAGKVADQLITENSALKEEVQKHKEEASEAKGNVAALEAEMAVLKASQSPQALKDTTTRFFNKVLCNSTCSEELNNLALLTNQAYGHELFRQIRRSLSPADRSHYAKYYRNPRARRAYEEALYNFRHSGVDSLKPSILGFLQNHEDFPSAMEIDAYAHDIDTGLLGEFVFVESEPSEDEEEEETVEQHIDQAVNEKEVTDDEEMDEAHF